MRTLLAGIVSAVVLACALATADAQSSSNPRVQSHVDAAKAAAGTDFGGVFNRICREAVPPETPAAPRSTERGARPPGPPARDTWHADPVKVFDNLYFLGQTEYSAWAVTTSAGIIIIDAIFDYSVDDEVVDGLKTLGLDPATIKYVVISHGHGDHSGGAKYLQDRFNARVILAAADWDLLDRSNGTKPRRDMIATDGQKLTLGDTTLTLYNTPGHTLGTLSTLIPVKDKGTPHVAAYWGGTAFNWVANRNAYISPERPDSFWFKTYSDSARRFKDITAKAGADVILSNHTDFDGSKTKLPALARRKAGDPHPYVIGKESVQRYMTPVNECAQEGLTRVLSATAADTMTALTSGGFAAALQDLLPQLEQSSGMKIVTKEGSTLATGPDSIPARLERGDAVDIVIMSATALDDLIKAGRIRPGSRVDLARSGIGMAVRAGARKPDISSVDALKRTLLEAKSVAYSSSISGVYLTTELFPRLGIADQMRAKSRRIDGERVAAVVARGEAEIGFQQVSELLPVPGIEFVGPLPPDVQRTTMFAAGIATTSAKPERARTLIAFLASAAALPAVVKSGLEPIAVGAK